MKHIRSRLIESSPEPAIRLLQHRFADLGSRLDRSVANTCRNRARQIEQLGKRLASVGPESVLQRGFALVSRADGSPVARAKDLAIDESVVTRFADGEVPMKVE